MCCRESLKETLCFSLRLKEESVSYVNMDLPMTFLFSLISCFMQVIWLANFPDQLFVVDHIAKPDIKNKKIDEWKKDIHGSRCS